jgi:hypothetical protein
MKLKTKTNKHKNDTNSQQKLQCNNTKQQNELFFYFSDYVKNNITLNNIQYYQKHIEY